MKKNKMVAEGYKKRLKILSPPYFLLKILSVDNVIRHGCMIDKLTFFVPDFNFRNVHRFPFSYKSGYCGYDSVFFTSQMIRIDIGSHSKIFTSVNKSE